MQKDYARFRLTSPSARRPPTFLGLHSCCLMHSCCLIFGKRSNDH